MIHFVMDSSFLTVENFSVNAMNSKANTLAKVSNVTVSAKSCSFRISYFLSSVYSVQATDYPIILMGNVIALAVRKQRKSIGTEIIEKINYRYLHFHAAITIVVFSIKIRLKMFTNNLKYKYNSLNLVTDYA